MRDWQDIETAPKEDIILITNGVWVDSGWWDAPRQGWVTDDPTPGSCVLEGVTHWMPLPSPPQPSKKGVVE